MIKLTSPVKPYWFKKLHELNQIVFGIPTIQIKSYAEKKKHKDRSPPKSQQSFFESRDL